MTYKDFIQNIIDTRGQWNDDIRKDYCERHHIVPKCLGGLPKTLTWQHHENIIWLTAREHFIAHKLLAEENPTNFSIVNAWNMMAFSKGDTKRDFEISPEEYDRLRELNHLTKVGKCFVPKETQLKVGRHNSKLAANRTEEEKEKIAEKKRQTFFSNYTEEEIETMYKKRGENAKNHSPEAKAAKKQKYLQTWANKTEEELLEHKKKSARPGKLNGAYGKHWFNNGVYRIFCEECPDGFNRGMGHNLKSIKELEDGKNDDRRENKD